VRETSDVIGHRVAANLLTISDRRRAAPAWLPAEVEVGWTNGWDPVPGGGDPHGAGAACRTTGLASRSVHVLVERVHDVVDGHLCRALIRRLRTATPYGPGRAPWLSPHRKGRRRPTTRAHERRYASWLSHSLMSTLANASGASSIIMWPAWGISV
jgi:hypothetical protein